MPRLIHPALEALRARPEVPEQAVIEAARAGATDAEIAAILGMRPADFDALLQEETALADAIEGLRAGRRVTLRAKVQAICMDDDHPAQGRLLREVLVGELQTDETERGDAGSFADMMALAGKVLGK